MVALSERNLLDQGYHDVLVAPEQLLAEMASRFQEARTVLLSVSHAWEALDAEMTAVEGEMTRLRTLAADLHPAASGATHPGEAPKELAELAEAEAELGRIRTLVAKDPLGAQGGVESALKPRLEALRARLDAERAQKGRVRAALDHARDLRKRLGEEHDRALGLAADARREVLRGAPALPLEEALLAGLDEWLHKLEGTAAAGRWSGAEVGLTRWRATAEQYLASSSAAAAAAEALLGRRGELAGRLSARRAQAAALAARGLALDPSFEARAREAEALLKHRPVPLDEAARLVEAYEAGVVALGNAARR